MEKDKIYPLTQTTSQKLHYFGWTQEMAKWHTEWKNLQQLRKSP